jgi:hypothetical protein
MSRFGQQGQAGQGQQPGQGPQIVKDMLPSTGLQRQLGSLQSQYQGMGDPRALGAQQQGQGAGPQPKFGATSLDAMAKRLAQSYGLSVGGGPMVDAQGNFLMTPDQLASGSGGAETMGSAAAKMNYIADAISKQQNMEQQAKGTAALQTGLGLVQSRGRGSLATLQEGTYQALAQQYSNQEYEAADFSYFIEKEKMDMQMEMLRKAERLAKKQARGAFIGGALGMIGSIATGNFAGAAASAGQLGASAGGTGWFAVLISCALSIALMGAM